jgi:hypothetical protein
MFPLSGKMKREGEDNGLGNGRKEKTKTQAGL